MVIQVGYNTAASLGRRSKRLHTLDLSWCRNLTDEAVGFIVDNCLSLRVLKLFGCTQVSISGQRCRDFEIMISFISTLRLVLKFLKLYVIGSKIILQADRFQDVITPFFFFFPFPDYKSFSRWPL